MSSYLCMFYVFLSAVKPEVIICSVRDQKREWESCSGVQCMTSTPNPSNWRGWEMIQRWKLMWHPLRSWLMETGRLLPDPLLPGILPQTWREDRLCHVVEHPHKPMIYYWGKISYDGIKVLRINYYKNFTEMGRMSSFSGRLWFKIQDFYLSHTRLYREHITSSEMWVRSAPWTVQIL